VLRILKGIGYAWCVAVVVAYLGHWLWSEHGGGLLFQSGFGDMWLIALAGLPGVGLIKLAKSMVNRD
jgi:hypothetical protein